KPVGRDIEWRSLEESSEHHVAEEIVVVTFHGNCDAQTNPFAQPESSGLGWTHMSDGEILPFAEVDCDRMRALVQTSLMRLAEANRGAVFGRAIARVIAHELYHIVAHTIHHGSGLSKPAYSAQELLSDEFVFDPQETKALRTLRKTRLSKKPTTSPSEI